MNTSESMASDGEMDEDFDDYSENFYYQPPQSVRSYDRNTQELLEAYNKDLTHKPELNVVSLEIASRLPHTSKERLFMQKPTSPRVEDVQYTFRPALNKKSVEIDSGKNKFDSFEQRINELYKKTSKKQQKIEEKKKEFMEKELEGCTFSPNVSKTVNKFNLKGKTVSDRAAIWEIRRKQKIIKGKREVDERELEGCTFSPNTQRLKISSPKENRDPLGYDEFLHRQKIAREKKSDVDKVFQTGTKWKNQITIPKEFSFGSKDGIKIKSLQKPVTNDQANKKTNYFNSSMDQSREPTMILDDGTLEFNEDEELLTQFTTPELNNSVNSTFSAPPQGLFSSKTSVSILDCIQDAEAAQTSPTKKSASKSSHRQTPQIDLISPSKEWLRRSKQKEEENIKYL